jgi:hypothetical protein
MIPKKPVPDLDPEDGNRISNKIVRKQDVTNGTDSILSDQTLMRPMGARASLRQSRPLDN